MNQPTNLDRNELLDEWALATVRHPEVRNDRRWRRVLTVIVDGDLASLAEEIDHDHLMVELIDLPEQVPVEFLELLEDSILDGEFEFEGGGE